MRLRCPFCARPVRPLWLRCPVCKTKQASWYLLALVIASAAAALLALFLYRESAGHISF
jgi:hypothetical protein